jgi:hypothetical protein
VKVLAIAVMLTASAAGAQDFTESTGGTLRWLDKLTGDTGDIELLRGQTAIAGRLAIQLDSCRYPTGNPASDATAHLTIMDSEIPEPAFSGWMLASSPALSALDHPRYDVWVLRCILPEGTTPETQETMPEASDE